MENTAQSHLSNLETQLNYILEHIRDSKSPFSGDFVERREEIERHARAAKKSFDWLDNCAIIKDECEKPLALSGNLAWENRNENS